MPKPIYFSISPNYKFQITNYKQITNIKFKISNFRILNIVILGLFVICNLFFVIYNFMPQNPFPKQFNYLSRAFANGKLHHSYIFYGPKDAGKFEFALYFARFIQCSAEKKEAPCGKCANCVVNKNGFVVNTYIINKGKNENIGIEEIRELQKNMDLSLGAGNRKIFIINNAQNLGREAKDALLKTLEEPTGKSLIILITDEKKLLPKTILSRCPAIFFSQGLFQIDFIQEMGEEQLELLEEIQTLLEPSLYPKMILVKDLNLDKGINEKVEKWIFILYHLLLFKEGLSSLPEEKISLKNLEKNLDYARIIKALERFRLALDSLDTNVSKRVLFEDLVLSI